MKNNIAVLILFVLLSFVMTLPLGLHLRTALENDGDLPSGIWIFGWIATNLWPHPSAALENPMFFPHPTSFPHGQHNYLPALLYAPLYYATRSFVAAWNLLYILTYAANGFCMYLLILYVTRNPFASIIAGIVFAFCPFRASLYGLTGFHSTYWTPLALLFLLRFFDRRAAGERRASFSLVLACVFCLCQWMTDIVLGIYFSLPFVTLFAYLLYTRRSIHGRPAYGSTAIAVSILAAGFVLFAMLIRPAGLSVGVVSMSREMNEIQELSAEVQSYLSVPVGNILYGESLRFLFTPAATSFPGALAYALALCALVRMKRSGGWLVLRLGGRAMRVCPRLGLRISREHYSLFFLFVFISAVLLSFGPEIRFFGKAICPGPYLLVYRLFPFMRPLRALGWFAIVAIMAVSALAGIGADAVLRWASRSGAARAPFLAVCLTLILLIEYATYPPTTEGRPLVYVPPEIPAVYRWLAEQPDKGAIIELPMAWEPEETLRSGSFGLDSMYIYWSLYHKRRLVNGYTSLWPPEFQTITDQMKLFPSRETIDILSFLGVRYVVFHAGKEPHTEWQRELLRQHPEAHYDWRETVRRAELFKDELIPRGKFGSDHLYELVRKETVPVFEEHSWAKPIPRSGWALTADRNAQIARHAVDGNRETAWDSGGNQVAGISFQIDLGDGYELSGLAMGLRNLGECPKNPLLEASVDGTRWERIDYGEPYLDLIARVLKDPRERTFRLRLPLVRARYLRFTLTRFDNMMPWSITELNIFGSPCQLPTALYRFHNELTVLRSDPPAARNAQFGILKLGHLRQLGL